MTPEERARNREMSLQQSFYALREAWVLLDSVMDDLPDGGTRDSVLQWLKKHLLWGTPETLDDCREWLQKYDD